MYYYFQHLKKLRAWLKAHPGKTEHDFLLRYPKLAVKRDILSRDFR